MDQASRHYAMRWQNHWGRQDSRPSQSHFDRNKMNQIVKNKTYLLDRSESLVASPSARSTSFIRKRSSLMKWGLFRVAESER